MTDLCVFAFFDRDNSLKNPASKAYGQVLSPYHGWAIRKAVAAGMYALPTKAQLLQKLNEDGKFFALNDIMLFFEVYLLDAKCKLAKLYKILKFVI